MYMYMYLGKLLRPDCGKLSQKILSMLDSYCPFSLKFSKLLPTDPVQWFPGLEVGIMSTTV